MYRVLDVGDIAITEAPLPCHDRVVAVGGVLKINRITLIGAHVSEAGLTDGGSVCLNRAANRVSAVGSGNGDDMANIIKTTGGIAMYRIHISRTSSVAKKPLVFHARNRHGRFEHHTAGVGIGLCPSGIQMSAWVWTDAYVHAGAGGAVALSGSDTVGAAGVHPDRLGSGIGGPFISYRNGNQTVDVCF